MLADNHGILPTGIEEGGGCSFFAGGGCVCRLSDEADGHRGAGRGGWE